MHIAAHVHCVPLVIGKVQPFISIYFYIKTASRSVKLKGKGGFVFWKSIRTGFCCTGVRHILLTQNVKRFVPGLRNLIANIILWKGRYFVYVLVDIRICTLKIQALLDKTVERK